MFCHKCGTQLAENAQFCQACGTPVAIPGVAEPNKGKKAKQKNSTNGLSTKMKVLILAAVVIVGFIKVQNIFGLFGGGSSGSSSGGSSSSISIGKPYERKKILDCLTCDGDGDCPKCDGYGTQENYAGAGDYVTSVCSTCHGSRTCRTCGGSGKR
ncbi:MAG: zinc-ribbon domain-containing protein [Oscillospiraceae bacterium]|nr:zinc-ribbon domain-containing protein [Oscillospiraceae bacterium]